MKITGVRPWLVKTAASYWGEFLFVEVTTDEGISGWGEITTTTRIANRALCSILSRLGDQLAGEDPSQIERLWHKVFRSFTYMGSRGAGVACVSSTALARWDHPERDRGQAIYDPNGEPVRDDSALSTQHDQRKIWSKEGVVKET